MKTQTYKLDQRVQLHSLGGDPMEGATGLIHGIMNNDAGMTKWPDHYIVWLERSLPNARSIVITEACLRPA